MTTFIGHSLSHMWKMIHSRGVHLSQKSGLSFNKLFIVTDTLTQMIILPTTIVLACSSLVGSKIANNENVQLIK